MKKNSLIKVSSDCNYVTYKKEKAVINSVLIVRFMLNGEKKETVGRVIDITPKYIVLDISERQVSTFLTITFKDLVKFRIHPIRLYTGHEMEFLVTDAMPYCWDKEEMEAELAEIEEAKRKKRQEAAKKRKKNKKKKRTT